MTESMAEFEAKELLQTIRTFFPILVQALSVMVIASITVIGYAIANKTAGILIVGAVIDVVSLGVLTVVDAWLLSPLYYRVVTLRKKLGPEGLEFVYIFLATYYYPSMPGELEKLAEIKDPEERTRKLHRLFLPTSKGLRQRVILCGSSAIGHLVAIALLVNLFGWNMF
jgi:hypothetical protein